MENLQALDGKLSRVDKLVASYFLENREQLADATVPQIALACGVSKAAIVRLCKKLGFAGFKGFITALSTEQAMAREGVGGRFYETTLGLSAEAICDLTAMLAIDIVKDTRRSLDILDVKRAVALLERSDSLSIFAWDNGITNAQDAQIKFTRLGFQASSAADSYSRGLLLRTLKAGDVALLFPRRGLSPDAQEALDEVHRRGAVALIITSGAQSYRLWEQDILFSTLLKGHLPDSGDMDHALAGNLVMSTLYLVLGTSLVESGRLPFTARKPT